MNKYGMKNKQTMCNDTQTTEEKKNINTSIRNHQSFIDTMKELKSQSSYLVRRDVARQGPEMQTKGEKHRK